MPIQMTYLGDNFDILTGILAVPAAYLAHIKPSLKWPIVAFNVFGLWMLARIFIIVSTSSPTPLRSLLGAYPTKPEVMVGLYTPYSWIAFVIVTGAIFLHVVSLRAVKPCPSQHDPTLHPGHW